MLKQFTNKYQLSKTLRFELIPVGKTKDILDKKGLVLEDEKRSEEYKIVKTLIDDYHRYFIQEALSGKNLLNLEKFENLFLKKDKNKDEEEDFNKIKTDLRKQIVSFFESNELFKNIDKKELIKVDLLNFLTDENDKNIVKKFSDFTTYFTGFHENRKNIYSADEKHSSIAYRVIHENLPIFISNKVAFLNISKEYPEIIKNTQKNLENHLLGAMVEDMFNLENFSLTLTQIYIDIYNTILGGKTLEDGTKIQGLNELINLYRQKNSIEKRKLPNLKPLHKQILSDKETMSWILEAFTKHEEIETAIEKLYHDNIVDFYCCDKRINILDEFENLFSKNDDYDLTKIFIKNDLSITSISQDIFKDYKIIKDALWQKYLNDNPKIVKSKDLSADEEKYFSRKNSYFSFFNILEALKFVEIKLDNESDFDLFEYFKNIVKEKSDLIKVSYLEWEKDKNNKKSTKDLLDNILNLQRAIKPIYVKSELDKDIVFYAMFDTYFESLNKIVKLYDMVRNFESKKPYSIEKFKLNFENSTLLNGWDLNKETDNTSLLFEKDGLYYLGIMNKKHNKSFLNKKESEENNCYKKIEYKLLPGANKMLPKVFFSNKNIDFYSPSDNLLENYKNGIHKKGTTFDLNFCHELIDFFKSSINKHPDWKNFSFQFSNTLEYNDISDFYREVEQQGYKISFKNIEIEFINNLINEEKLYLFQIYNKDFSPYSKGTPNLHTLYWKMVFDKENLKNVVYKLNGQAEIFYRKKSIEYSDDKLNKGHHYEDLKDKFNYPIIKDKRFTMDKFQFHVPITINFKALGKNNINNDVNEFIKQNHKGIKIIGIDRGERHLLYLSLIDNNGKIIEQYSLNEIVNNYNNQEFKVDYQDLLDKKEKDRAFARENWGIIENIKELKEGYISQVIHKIATLIVKYNAIVVLEDLNFGFKRGRFKVEKQVYQKFEKMLIDKLNYLVDKKKTSNEIGGVLNALQLTSKFESFERLGKQSGFLFYVPAWNTSNIDPVTGFVNFFDTKYQNVEKAKEFFSKFDYIKYNIKKDYFEFAFDYNNFTQKAKDTKTKWALCTYGTRIKTFRNKEKNNQWDNIEVDLTTEFKKLLQATENKDLKEFITSQNTKDFFEQLLYLFRLTLQMRNSITNSKIDYIVSPVADKNDIFYDSRNLSIALPKDADANGAYNIARKGLMIVEKIKKSDNNKIDMKITNKEWLQFVQGK